MLLSDTAKGITGNEEEKNETKTDKPKDELSFAE